MFSIVARDELIAAIQTEIGSLPALAQTEGQSVDVRSLVESALLLRQRRERFPGRFCLWLYAGSVDQDIDESNLYPTVTEMKRSGLDWDQLVAARRLALTQRASLLDMVTSTASALHQQTGMYLLSLTPARDQSDLPGLVVYPTAADNASADWYLLVSQLAELAEAIIMVGSLGENFLAELQYLHASGAYRRELFLLNDRLVYGAGGEVKGNWPLSEIGAAVTFTAAQAMDLPWYSRPRTAQP